MSLPIAPPQHDKPSFRHFEELGADFFDQFLTFENIENASSSTESRKTDSISTDHGSSDTPNNILDWPGESWIFDHGPTSSDQEPTIYCETTGRASVSDSELLSVQGINLGSTEDKAATHHSLPSSPLQINGLNSRKKKFVESKSIKMKRSTSNFKKSLRSPIRKINRSPKMARTMFSTLEHKVDLLKFEFDFEKDPAKISGEIQTNGVEHSIETPNSTSLLDSESSRRTSSQTRSSDGLLPCTPLQEHHVNGWSRVPLPTDMNLYDSPLTYTSEGEAPIWWNDASTAPMAQPSPTALHINSQRVTKSLAHQLQNDISRKQNEAVYAPSNISRSLLQIPHGSPTRPFVVESPCIQQSYFGATLPIYLARHRPNNHSRSLRHLVQSPSLTKRIPPPTSESDSPSPRSHQVRKRKTPRKERNSVPRSPSIGGGADFVNFTPSDSKKILNGVAPSGSSKTKARREQEAMEKRRRLSQAAVRAVRAAGGDVESLLEQGLLV